MKEELQQKSVEAYFKELKVPKGKKEKVLMAITDMVYSRNQRIIELQKEKDSEQRKIISKIIDEKEVLIKERIKKVLEGQEEKITYDY